MYSILLIDEDKQNVCTLQEYLKKEGFRVYSSYGAKSGFLKAKDKNPDMIIMELNYAGFDGYDLLNEIRSDKNLMYPYLLVYSQRLDDLDKVLALEMGADDYITKPSSLREISARVKSQFRYLRRKSS